MGFLQCLHIGLNLWLTLFNIDKADALCIVVYISLYFFTMKEEGGGFVSVTYKYILISKLKDQV